MAKFMIAATYNAEGTKGLLKEGGSSRRAVVKKAIEGLGGTLEGFYFAFGENDAVVICDVPDVISGLAICHGRRFVGRSPREDDAAHHA